MRPIREIFRDYAVFDSEGRHINGTDKESNHHYGDAYDSLFGDSHQRSREQVKMVMEVGVADGSCLQAWKEVFPNATIVGMDIHPSDRANGERIEFYIGDQRNQKDCEYAARDRLFDMIVEDATHKTGDTLLTLFWLWPFVKSGGVYVIEEFENATSVKQNIRALWPFAHIIGTCGPYIEDEPLIVLRKSS